MVIGFTSGVFDLFHVGHVRLLKKSRALCDRLIVGVSSDDLVSYKNKRAIIPFDERCEVVAACKYVDCIVEQTTMDKMAFWKKLKFNVMFVGDDWYETEKWKIFSEEFAKVNVNIIYFPYTKGTSSTLINETLISLRG